MPVSPSQLSVALAVVRNQHNEVLLSYRNASQDQGEKWEFPGGKLETGESFKSALRRELEEETGLVLQRANSLIQFRFAYAQQIIHFHAFLVDRYYGEVDQRRCPSCRWQTVGDLAQTHMPCANEIIRNALRLPARYMITADHHRPATIINQLKSALDTGTALIQLRADSLSRTAYTKLASQCYDICQQYRATLIVNCCLDWLCDIAAHGFHLKSQALHAFATIDNCVLNDLPLFSVSVHNQQELELANPLNPQCVLVAPVLPTTSHPDANLLDWSGFHSLALRANCPAYALGGLDENHLGLARAHAGQGIAGISMFVSKQ